MKPADGAMSNRTVVYRYAIHGDLPEAALAELSRAHQLQTRLVEIERAYGEQVTGVWRRSRKSPPPTSGSRSAAPGWRS